VAANAPDPAVPADVLLAPELFLQQTGQGIMPERITASLRDLAARTL
jgi:hypothetical protein